MNRVVEILCHRDNISVQEATERVEYVRELLSHYNYDYDEAETLLLEELGLEMDYIMDIL